MSNQTLIALLAATTMLVGGTAFASDQAAKQPTPAPGHAAVVKNFGKLSADGARAYQDLTLARVAIFDGRPADAKKDVEDADSGFNKAKGDESVFTEAESTMRSHTVQKGGQAKAATEPQGAPNASPASNSSTPNSSASNETDVNKPVAWLPVDGAISINEDFTAKPEKAKAVQDANKSLAQGDKKGAMEKLKLAEVDTSVTLAVVPLQQTIDDVNQAKQLIEAGKYYEGSQKLRAVQDSTVLTIADMPDTATKGQGGSRGAPAATH